MYTILIFKGVVKFCGAWSAPPKSYPWKQGLLYFQILSLPFSPVRTGQGMYTAGMSYCLTTVILMPALFSPKIFYKKIYLHINNTARTYISGVIFFPFLHNRLITT